MRLNHFAKTSRNYYGLTLVYLLPWSTSRARRVECRRRVSEHGSPPPTRPCPCLRVPGQEVHRPRVELRDVLVDRRMGAVLEDDELRVLDPFGQRAGEPGRGRGVALAEGDLGRGLDAAEHAGRVMREHRVRLAQEG